MRLRVGMVEKRFTPALGQAWLIIPLKAGMFPVVNDPLTETLRQELEDANNQAFSDAEELARLAAKLEAAQLENARLTEDLHKQPASAAQQSKVSMIMSQHVPIGNACLLTTKSHVAIAVQ